jgi:hypothetical protein
VFSIGGGPGVRPRLELTVCPVKVEAPWAGAFVEWVLAVLDRAPWDGKPQGVREWPRPGGLHEQHAVVVEAVWVVIGELHEILTPKAEPVPTPPTPKTP